MNFYMEYHEAKMQEFREVMITLAGGYEMWAGKFQQRNQWKNKTIPENKTKLKGIQVRLNIKEIIVDTDARNEKSNI